MSLKGLVLAILAAVCIFPPHAVAQRNELSGLVGRTFISDQGINKALKGRFLPILTYTLATG